MQLSEYPRPPQDNGFGMHFGLDLRAGSLDRFVPLMEELRIKWCLVAHSDEGQLERAAMAMGGASIMPISRWLCQVDQNGLDFVRFVRLLQSLDLPAYIQIMNDPSDGRQWKDGVPIQATFVERWCDHAAQVAEAGGLPGLQVSHPDELAAVLHELESRRADVVLGSMWFCAHIYPGNHPPDYPYDELNQKEHPGATVDDDQRSILSFTIMARVFEQELGWVPPFILGETGWMFGSEEDPRYPEIGETNHAGFHVALLDWFQSGRLSNGEPLPDYLFAACPWILFGYETEAWFSWTSGTREETLLAIRALAPFVRAPAAPELPREPLAHYVWFGEHSTSRDEALASARDYLAHFGLPYGYSMDLALSARQVTIVGDYGCVSAESERRLREAGCRVERLLGDVHALQVIWNDRIARKAEFG